MLFYIFSPFINITEISADIKLGAWFPTSLVYFSKDPSNTTSFLSTHRCVILVVIFYCFCFLRVARYLGYLY